jgi:hypothetical protein
MTWKYSFYSVIYLFSGWNLFSQLIILKYYKDQKEILLFSSVLIWNNYI